MVFARTRFLAALVAAVTLLSAAPAVAQTPTALTNWQLSVGEVLAKQVGPVPEWRVALGGGIDLDPIYEGSKRYWALPSVVVDIRYRDLFFLSDGEGLGVNVLRGQNYRAGVSLGYDFGRNHHIQHRLAGLGNVDPAPQVKLFGQYFLKAVVLDMDVRKALWGNNGVAGDLGFYVPLPVPIAEHFYIFTGPSVSFADDRFMQAYFTVSESQSSRSIFPPYTARGGIYKSGWGLTSVFGLGGPWWLEVEGAWQYLLGGAGQSPIVEDRSDFHADFNVVYRF
jgi:outer membrane scaffolding protein for murein synthesis (MipA/OmpV family)